MAFQVAVCGPADCTERQAGAARRVGELLADRGAVVLCGGGGGVMAAAAAGVRLAGGIVVGIRPDGRHPDVPADLSVTVSTGLGQARNAVLVASADAVIAVGGSWGTLSEVALGMRRGNVPVVWLDGWTVLAGDGSAVPGIRYAATPEDAVALAGAGWPG